MVINEYIFYSADPMETVKKDLKNSNQELLRLIVIRPKTKEIKARIDDLRKKHKKIEQYGVSEIFEIFYEIGNIFINVILFLFFI